MIHRANADFWHDYRALPANIRARADKQFALLTDNPQHPSLHSKNSVNVTGRKFGRQLDVVVVTLVNISLDMRHVAHCSSDDKDNPPQRTETAF
jgi:hypothetical protein